MGSCSQRTSPVLASGRESKCGHPYDAGNGHARSVDQLWFEINSQRLKATHNPPTPKTNPSPSFCFSGNCKVTTTGMGSNKMMTSVAILNPAFEYQLSRRLMQVPGTFLIQAFLTGKH